jgi:hypothetical protein
MSYLHKVQNQAKQIHALKYQSSGYQRQGHYLPEEDLGDFWGANHVLCLHLGAGYILHHLVKIHQYDECTKYAYFSLYYHSIKKLN